MERPEDKIYTITLRVDRFILADKNSVTLELTHSELLNCIGGLTKLLRKEFESQDGISDIKKEKMKQYYRKNRKATVHART